MINKVRHLSMLIHASAWLTEISIYVDLVLSFLETVPKKIPTRVICKIYYTVTIKMCVFNTVYRSICNQLCLL